MQKIQRVTGLLSLVLFLSACSTEIVTSCEPDDMVIPICGFQQPEDLEPLPQLGGILVSEMGDMGRVPGALSWHQPGSEPTRVELLNNNNFAKNSGGGTWGETQCSLPDQFSPHGIHLSTRGDSLQLLLVNHSSRERVLFYEVLTSPKSPPTLAWRGCVLLPENAAINDVAALADGGFVVTHMYDKQNDTLAQLTSFLGINKGHVWRWQPQQGLRVIAGSEARYPNGIAVSQDGKQFLVNNYIDGEVKAYSVDTEKLVSVTSVPNIDNSAWLEDGRLLIASHRTPFTMMPCFGVMAGSCGHGYDLVALDTESGATETIFKHQGGGPFGPATVAVPYEGKLYAGSFSGDRIAVLQ